MTHRRGQRRCTDGPGYVWIGGEIASLRQRWRTSPGEGPTARAQCAEEAGALQTLRIPKALRSHFR